MPGAFTFKRRHSGQASARLDAIYPMLLASRSISLTPFRTQVPCGTPNGTFHAKVSADCAMKGEWRKALQHDLRAIRLAPLYWRVWANAVLLLGPASVVRPFYEALKRPWHAFRQSWHSASSSS